MVSFLRVGSLLPVVAGLGCAQILGIEDTVVESAAKPRATAEKPAFTDAGGLDAGPRQAEDARAPLAGADFRCSGTSWLIPSVETAIEVVAIIHDRETGDPVAGIRIIECKRRLGVDCSGGVARSNEDGIARLTVKRGFNGYFKLEGPDAAGNERVGQLWYLSEPISNSYVFPIDSMTREFRDSFLYDDVARDETRGEIEAQIVDCTSDTGTVQISRTAVPSAPGVAAPGIQLEITDEGFLDDDSREFYISDGKPVSPPTATVTDISGRAGFLNVIEGSVPLRALRGESGQLLAGDTVLVRSDFVTMLRLLPE